MHTIAGVASSITAFVGFLRSGVVDTPVVLTSFKDFEREFGGIDRDSPLSYAVLAYFINGGGQAIVVRVGSAGPAGKDDLIGATATTGINALLGVAAFNLLCIPDTFDLSDPDAAAVANAAILLCQSRRAFYLVDAPRTKQLGDIVAWVDTLAPSPNAAVYFPAITMADPGDNTQHRTIAPSGAVAGLVARVDASRGLWKAPAGNDAALHGVLGLAVSISDGQNSVINRSRVNALRGFPGFGTVVWGSRTLAGADSHNNEFKYVPVRRLALFIQESLLRGTQWAAFEPNDEALWSQIRRDVGAFMEQQFRNGALQGRTSKEAYFVRCGSDTTTQSDIDDGVFNILVGFAPLKPAEFVMLDCRQTAGGGGG